MSLDEAEIHNLTGTITVINKKIMNDHVKITYLKGLLQKTEDTMHDNIIFNNILAQRRDSLMEN